MKRADLIQRKQFLFNVKEVTLDELNRAKLELEAIQYMLENRFNLNLDGGTIIRLLESEDKRKRSINDLKVELAMILLQIHEADCRLSIKINR